MLLIANGCSHTAGAEIERPMQGECYEKAWPQKITNKLGWENKNLAVSGASDSRVSRTTIQFIGRLKKMDKFDPAKTFIIVSWPGLFRHEIHKIIDNEAGFWDNDWMPLVAGNDEVYKKQCSPSSYAYYKAWMMRLNPVQETIKFYSNVLLLQNFLIANKIKFLFWNACSNVPKDKDAFYDEIYHKRFPYLTDLEYSYTNLIHSNGFKHSIYAEFGHYGEDAQDWFADLISNYIEKNKLL
jgi:hypothetical protein